MIGLRITGTLLQATSTIRLYADHRRHSPSDAAIAPVGEKFFRHRYGAEASHVDSTFRQTGRDQLEVGGGRQIEVSFFAAALDPNLVTE